MININIAKSGGLQVTLFKEVDKFILDKVFINNKFWMYFKDGPDSDAGVI